MTRSYRLITALLIVIIIVLVSFTGCFEDNKKPPAGNEPPIANIVSASPDEGKAPLTVYFEGEGIDNDGTIESYHWDFNDGDISTDQNPTHVFQDPGNYKVVFTVTDSDGDTAQDNTYVNVIYAENFPPTAIATANQTRVYVNHPLTFYGHGTDQDGSIASYEWDFDGDGVYDWYSDTAGNTTYTYSTAGIYDAEFKVTDNNLGTDTETVTITVDSLENRYPVAEIVSPDDGDSFEVNHPVNFDGAGSYDPEGENLTYIWRFGDGATGNGITTTHTYGSTGNFEITLIVNDGDLESEHQIAITIYEPPPQNNPPEAVIVEPVEGASFEVGDSVYFDGSGSSDPNGDPISYFWDFGDGVTGTGATTTHTYSESTTYTVILTVNDGEYEDSDSVDIFIALPGGTNQPPDAVIVEPDNGDRFEINETVNFNGSGSSDPDGDELNYTWDFGDGDRGYGVETTHKYTQNDTYTIILTVNDSVIADSDSRVIVVGSGVVPNTPPTAVISTPEMGDSYEVNEVVYCNGSDSFDLETASEDLSYDWDFGDGSAHSTAANTTHKYTSDGIFIITLSVSDGELNDTTSVLITITASSSDNNPPTAVIVEPGNGDQFFEDEDIDFDGTNSSDPDGDPLTYKWYFGDGAIGTGAVTNHTYANPGVYLVTLEVSDGEFNDTDIVSIIIKIRLGGRGTKEAMNTPDTASEDDSEELFQEDIKMKKEI